MLTAMLMAAVLQANAVEDFPEGAYVVVQCVAGRNETVSDCHALEVSHPGQGLEDAAIAMVRRARMGQRNGVTVGRAFRIRIVFRLADDGDDLAPPRMSSDEARLDPY